MLLCSSGIVHWLADLLCTLSSGVCGYAGSYYLVSKHKCSCLFCKCLYVGIVPSSNGSICEPWRRRPMLLTHSVSWHWKKLSQKVAPIILEPSALACWTTALPLCWKELPWYSQRFNIWLSKQNYFINNKKKVVWAEYNRTWKKTLTLVCTQPETEQCHYSVIKVSSKIFTYYWHLQVKKRKPVLRQNSLSSHNISLERRTKLMCKVGNMLQDWPNQPPVGS